MYESPVKLIMSDIKLQVDEKLEEACYTAVMDYFPNVDREELIRALRYDRQQYDRGYEDGRRDALEELVHCKDCVEYIAKSEYCFIHGACTYADDFCSHGRKERQ